jgi:hypothetical protein
MATSSFSNLPNDILAAVLTQLKLISETDQNLTSCSLVNRCWYEATTPILYGNIALKQDNLSRFNEHLQASKYGACVHSLTISLQPYEDLEPIAQLVPLLSQFKNIRSFSFWLSKGYHDTIPQINLVRLVDALPISCTSLELDTFGFDAREVEEQTHLCDSLRKILPRMQHVRLRLRTCEALFADPSTPDSLIRLPDIKTFIYNCSRPPGTPLPTCRCTDNSPITHANPDLLWHTVTTSLEKIVSTPDAVPKEAKVYAFMTTDRDDNDRSLWQAHIRADMQSQSSLALPHRSVWMEAMVRGSWVIRLPDDSELMTIPANIEAIAEGQLWHEVVGGVRLPAAVLADLRAGKASFAVGCVENELALLKTSQQWREDNPGKSTSHWYNEKLTGVRLLCAEEREGKEEYLLLRPIWEATPQGLERVGINDVLEKVKA